jgi:SAM-dependent methyltransferase
LPRLFFRKYKECTMSNSEPIPLYRDGRHYDELIRSFALADLPFYLEEAKRGRGPMLELACGTGRLTIPIAQSGVEIVGLDQSASTLAYARTKAGDAGVNITWVEADCRQFDLGRKFALIFMPFNSMQHLHDHPSLASLFDNVGKHLAEGGRFIFDVFNPSVAILNRDPNQRYVERQYEDPDGRGTITLEQTALYDDAAQVNRITWYFSRPEEKDFRVEQLHMRCFFPQEMDLLARANGFAVEEKFSNFERQPFAGGGMKQVMVCRKRT